MNNTSRSNRHVLSSCVTLITLLLISATFMEARPARNGKIAFVSTRDGNQEIYVMDPDGTNQTRITTNNTYDLHPKWSPDGARIAFVSERAGGGGSAIFVMNANGTGRTQITLYHCGEGLNWSPDGQKIAFADCADPNEGVGDIFVVNADGSGRRNVTADPTHDYFPVWSPDGSKIMFSKYDIYPPSGYGGTMLHTIRPDGTGLTRLANGFAHGWNEDDADWSRVGNKIVYSVNQWDFNQAVFIANADGTDRQFFAGCGLGLCTAIDAVKPAWSPDGSKVVYSQDDAFNTYSEIWVGNTDGSGSTKLTSGAQGKNFQPSWQPLPSGVEFDYGGDLRASISVRRPADNKWYVRGVNGFSSMTWGQAGDLLAPADYDGDGKTDIAVFRPSNGTWYVVNSSNGAFLTYNWGAGGDLPVPADHNADGKADLVLFRQSNGMFYRRMSDNSFSNVSFGVAGDKPVIGDFDNDGQFDIGVFRSSNNNWYIRKSTAGFFVQTWGEAGDVPVPADYDGDGQTDLAVWRSSNGRWYRALSTAGFDGVNWGQAGDKPIPADYDGDGKSDVAIFRPSTGTWYMIGTTIGQLVQQFGQDGDVPTPSAFIY